PAKVSWRPVTVLGLDDDHANVAGKLQISRLRTLGSFVSRSWMFSPGRRLEIRLPVSTATQASC
ncbi:efflux RND transporter periplasmic adaptor subunit, partial [Xanthomonas sp. WHRI 8391]